MKNTLLTLVLLFAFATNAQASDDQIVLDFMKDHEVYSSKVYCRDEVKVAECRVLTLYSSIETSQVVKAFQISFFAPNRPFAAAELFLPVEGSVTFSGSGVYRNYVDNTMNGEFSVSSSGTHRIQKDERSITILDLPFGSLSFTDNEAFVTLQNGNQIIYSERR